MRSRSLMVSLLAAAATVATVVPASAQDSAHRLHGRTTVTVTPAITRALLRAGILPVVTAPGRPSLAFTPDGLTLAATFPVTGGTLSTSPLGGSIDHSGGLEFVNLANGKHLEVEDFVIDLNDADLTGEVAGTTERVPVFTLDLSKAKVQVRHGDLDASGINLNLTPTAAGALDQALGTSVFTAGLPVASAATDVDR